MLERVWRFIGSVKLAVPLLSAIVGILIWATFYESQVGSTTVQQEIYKSPWFGGLMFLLAINLGISALNRYPWRGARKIGFALTHLGLIVIIAGSAAVIHLGTEGMLLVRTDRPASDRLRIEGNLIEVMSADGEIKQSSIFVRQDGTVNPSKFAGLELAGYTENAVQTVDFVDSATVDNPAVKLSLKSDRMGQTITRSLAVAPTAYSQLTLGIAELEIVEADSQPELQQLLSPPQEKAHPWGTIEVATATNSKTIDVLETKSQPAKIKDLQIKVLDFFPDFRLDKNNFPTTASQQFNNPAVLLEVASKSGIERWFVFGKADLPPVHTLVEGDNIENLQLAYQVQPPEAEDYFKIIVNENNQLYYAAKSSHGFKSDSLAVGKSVTPGWADFQITLEEFIPHAQIHRQVVPVEDRQLQGSPALLIKTQSQNEAWLPWGEPTTINDPDGEIFAAFTPKLIQIPFGIKLEDFIVDRNEGSDSVAMWTSKIRIEDKANGVVEQRKVWMNHPTWYRGWKIAQASWNPGDLQQSTLQVKREPAWVTALTWIGSALVVLGIAVMFYAPALTRKLRSRSKEEKLETATETTNDNETKELTGVS
ncbi:cytochrome c biogenesis protein ResB [Myxosarcina sp. GI1]|uniref:cytochrome c biogenesis protein ResB n=1 Tax=Myxosarcina sp. GI1 TaxID=1541065 RepID=UPI00068BC342|nr:cytochrome c biogenesis protein ResB [Myxosarcina sp. GI1]